MDFFQGLMSEPQEPRAQLPQLQTPRASVSCWFKASALPRAEVSRNLASSGLALSQHALGLEKGLELFLEEAVLHRL